MDSHPFIVNVMGCPVRALLFRFSCRNLWAWHREIVRFVHSWFSIWFQTVFSISRMRVKPTAAFFLEMPQVTREITLIEVSMHFYWHDFILWFWIIVWSAFFHGKSFYFVDSRNVVHIQNVKWIKSQFGINLKSHEFNLFIHYARIEFSHLFFPHIEIYFSCFSSCLMLKKRRLRLFAFSRMRRTKKVPVFVSNFWVKMAMR